MENKLLLNSRRSFDNMHHSIIAGIRGIFASRVQEIKVHLTRHTRMRLHDKKIPISLSATNSGWMRIAGIELRD